LTRVFDDDEEDDDSSSSKLKTRKGISSQVINPMTSMRNSSPGLASFSRKVYKARVVGVDIQARI